MTDYFIDEKAEHFHKLFNDSDEAIQVIKSHEVSNEAELTVDDLIPAMGELFFACQMSPSDNCFLRNVTNSPTNIVMKCDFFLAALMAIKDCKENG